MNNALAHALPAGDPPVTAPTLRRLLGDGYLSDAELDCLQSLAAILQASVAARRGGVADRARLALALAALLVADDWRQTEGRLEVEIQIGLARAPIADLLANYAARRATAGRE